MRSRATLALALGVTVLGGAGVLLAATAGPANAAAANPAAPSVRTSAPAPAVPSHPITVELPGLATVSVNVPDVPALLGAGRRSSDEKAPARPAEPEPQSSQPAATPSTPRTAAATPSAAPSHPREAAAAPRRAAATPTTTRPKTASIARAVSDTRRGSGGGTNDRHSAKPAARHKPAAAKARPIAEVFQGMLHPGLPVWLLLGIVVACGAGTVLVVRSAGRKSLT